MTSRSSQVQQDKAKVVVTPRLARVSTVKSALIFVYSLSEKENNIYQILYNKYVMYGKQNNIAFIANNTEASIILADKPRNKKRIG